MAILSHKEKNNNNKNKNELFFYEKNKHNFYSAVVKELTFKSSPMLGGNHFSPFPPIS
jgi:hypothetical protein